MKLYKKVKISKSFGKKTVEQHDFTLPLYRARRFLVLCACTDKARQPARAATARVLLPELGFIVEQIE